MRVDAIVAAAEFGAGLREDRLIALARLQSWLVGRRPKDSALQIAQIAKRSPTVPRGIFAPPRHCQVAPTTITTAGAGDGHMIAAVGKKMDLRRRPGRIGEDPHHAFFFGSDAARGAG